MNDKENMTLNEAALYLRIHASTLARHAKAGKVPHFRLGRKLLFSREKLDEMMSGKHENKNER